MNGDAAAPLSGQPAAEALVEVHGHDPTGLRLTTPWWYHPLLGLSFAAVIGSFSLPKPMMQVALPLALGVQLALLWLYRRLICCCATARSATPDLKRAAARENVAMVGLFLGAFAAERYFAVRGGAAVVGLVGGSALVVFWRRTDREVVRLWREAGADS